MSELYASILKKAYPTVYEAVQARASDLPKPLNVDIGDVVGYLLSIYPSANVREHEYLKRILAVLLLTYQPAKIYYRCGRKIKNGIRKEVYGISKLSAYILSGLAFAAIKRFEHDDAFRTEVLELHGKILEKFGG